jgi:hypothetical protein
MTDSFAPEASQRLVLVVGQGRSGTSLFSGILGRMGFHVPQPEVKADKTNPRGFGEPRWVVNFHTRLMRARRVTVFDSRYTAWEGLAEVAEDELVIEELRSWLAVQFVGTENIVVKDPRNVWFLPLWRRCAADLGVRTAFVTMLRHPTEVVASARASYGTWQNDTSRAASWVNVMLHSEYGTRGSKRAFVCYEDLIEDWPREISRCGDLLDVPWLVGVDRSQHPEVDAFVDPALRRSPRGWEAVQVRPDLQAMCEQVWDAITALADPGGETDEARKKLDAARDAYIDFYAAAEAVAQSSVTAVKPHGQPLATETARASNGQAVGGLKSAVPARLRRSALVVNVRESLRASEGLPLPVRAMLILPPKYRERLPLPVVHAARWVVRATRR